MPRSLFILLVALFVSSVLGAPFASGFPYGSQKVRGVNIGGWLVLEPWITPTLFDNTGDNRVIDEWTFGQFVPNAKNILQQHWDTWITESDFADIAAAGYILSHTAFCLGFALIAIT